MFGGIGMPELIVIFVIALLVFGPKRLPDVGKSIGEAIKGFRKSMSEPDKPPAEELEKEAKAEPVSKRSG